MLIWSHLLNSELKKPTQVLILPHAQVSTWILNHSNTRWTSQCKCSLLTPTTRPWSWFSSKLLTIASIVCILLILYRHSVFLLHAKAIILRTWSNSIPSCEEQVSQFRAKPQTDVCFIRLLLHFNKEKLHLCVCVCFFSFSFERAVSACRWKSAFSAEPAWLVSPALFPEELVPKLLSMGESAVTPRDEPHSSTRGGRHPHSSCGS